MWWKKSYERVRRRFFLSDQNGARPCVTKRTPAQEHGADKFDFRTWEEAYDAAGHDGVRSKTDLIGLQEWTPLASVVRTENPQAPVQGNIISPQGDEIDGGLQDKVRLVVGVMDMCV